VAIKESSADIRRIAAIKALIDDRLHILVGVDDMIVEGIAAGATGWIAGLVNAYPRESVVLFDLAMQGRHEELRALYEWFLPLLRLRRRSRSSSSWARKRSAWKCRSARAPPPGRGKERLQRRSSPLRRRTDSRTRGPNHR
jgi:dihydrodipicolinate synthase/N-acetylneuraminate lyase